MYIHSGGGVAGCLFVCWCYLFQYIEMCIEIIIIERYLFGFKLSVDIILHLYIYQ